MLKSGKTLLPSRTKHPGEKAMAIKKKFTHYYGENFFSDYIQTTSVIWDRKFENFSKSASFLSEHNSYQITSYHSISWFPYLSKIFEKIISSNLKTIFVLIIQWSLTKLWSNSFSGPKIWHWKKKKDNTFVQSKILPILLQGSAVSLLFTS